MFRKIFRPQFIFFAALLVTGLFIYDDYGLSFDEAVQRKENGMVNYNYITGNDKSLLQAPEKYHGPVFEIFLIFIERTFNLTDERSIFLSRHLVTFLLFFTGVIFFYRLARNYFNTDSAALLSSIILVLSPRIFADSFYNSKDIPFLSVYIISVYFFTRFLKKKDFRSAFLHALFTGILIDIRIIGIIVPVLTVLFFLTDRIFKVHAERLSISSRYLLLYLLLSGGFIILFWPILWKSPLVHFAAAWSEMSKFPWYGDIMYMGKLYLPDILPWHYLPVWIFISTPAAYGILFCAGVLFVIIRLLKSPVKFYRSERESIIFMAWFFAPLVAVILLGSVVYDGWRHLYFIYPALVLLSVKGFYSVINFLQEKQFILLKRVLNAVFLLSLINVGVIMARSHPYQNVYFNFSVKDPENKFERDYWGLSFRKGLEHILETDTSSKIMFTGSNADVALNRWILPRKDRKRLVHTIRFEYADYYLDNFRWRRRVNQPVEEIFSLNPMNIKIMSVYKVLRQGEPGKTVLTIANDFEKPSPGWELYHDTIIGAAAHSGIKVFRITGSDVFSMGINIPYDSLTKNAQPLVVHASLQVFAFDARKIPSIVINVRNREKQDIYWKRADLWISSEVELNQWNEMVFSTEIPKSIPSPHEFKVYIWNPSKGNLYIDDVTIKVFEENQ